jgi:hypothetical protein
MIYGVPMRIDRLIGEDVLSENELKILLPYLRPCPKNINFLTNMIVLKIF